ncbi:YjbQ family protein, partial [Desulfovibrio sp. 1214_IL3152]|uniref:YjbQ family protein n=1 Tax=Desulfovibrio sp. 1214_IL3152 TaxID=3084056 RepID=UPI002FDA76D4
MLHLEIETTCRCDMRDITMQLRGLVRRNSIEKGWRNGVLALFCPHTTCGLTVNEGADPDVRRDMLTFFSDLVPR